MRPEDFRAIEVHFVKTGLSRGSARFAFSKFIENVEDAIKREEKRSGEMISREDERRICETFLNKSNLDNYLQLAQVNEETELNTVINRVGGGIFYKYLLPVMLNITASFLFIVLTILIYAAAKDSIIGMLKTLGIVP